jgi:hypothetical protein
MAALLAASCDKLGKNRNKLGNKGPISFRKIPQSNLMNSDNNTIIPKYIAGKIVHSVCIISTKLVPKKWSCFFSNMSTTLTARLYKLWTTLIAHSRA